MLLTSNHIWTAFNPNMSLGLRQEGAEQNGRFEQTKRPFWFSLDALGDGGFALQMSSMAYLGLKGFFNDA